MHLLGQNLEEEVFNSKFMGNLAGERTVTESNTGKR